LVEFWASWCGPCRMEIPHMKKAYQKYRKKGFEIASFTLDSDMEDWEVASEEEEIPWLNLGDLKAMQSPVAKLYGVSGVPTNYLVEGGTGKIIAKNLRQDALDKKLAELLEGSTAMD
ncbi:MAG: TlpA family protein disulfide reductase, partial [Porticoccaceae bacterium]|nr:TlpA family protein disulfide reductase [Porticoccaceae bacterium]